MGGERATSASCLKNVSNRGQERREMLDHPKDLDSLLVRVMDACEANTALLERLVLLKEYELGVTVEYDEGPYISEPRRSA
jgi:hypothetical protein